MSRHRDYPDLLTTILGMSLHEIEWEQPKLSRATVARLKAQADRIGRMIAADWINVAKERLADIGQQIAADALDQQRRDEAEAERQEAERAAAETQAIIDRLVERDLPALKAELIQKRKQRKAMGKAVARERVKLEAAVRKLARAKLARFKARR
jgi:hypothetical protein